MAKRIVGTIDQRIIKRGAGLLNVYYTVRQIAEKLGLDPRYIRRTIIGKWGAPGRSWQKITICKTAKTNKIGRLS